MNTCNTASLRIKKNYFVDCTLYNLTTRLEVCFWVNLKFFSLRNQVLQGLLPEFTKTTKPLMTISSEDDYERTPTKYKNFMLLGMNECNSKQ